MSADTAAPQPNEWKPSFNPWLIAISIMMATIIEVLDTSVANVSLPYIAGNLSASTDEATWVLTSYLLSNAIILPATNWLGQVFGRKRFLIGCITLFTIASALCGIAGSLGFLIMARVIQGAAGGALRRGSVNTSNFASGLSARCWPTQSITSSVSTGEAMDASISESCAVRTALLPAADLVTAALWAEKAVVPHRL